MLAYSGKILYIDLSSEQVWTHTLSTDLITRFLGGRGINAKLLWDLVTPETPPFSPDNRLIFGTGVLTCTTAPASGRMTVTCKSPATHLYLKSSGGGHVGAEMKFAGYDHLVIQGKAKTPTVVVIDDNNVSFMNASEIWGSHIRKTNNIIKQKLNDPGFKIACIGPAGENLIPFASIMLSVYHAFGRGGAGAVMGSKQLKAIAIRGTGDIVVKKPQQFVDVAQRLREAFLNDTQGKKYFLFGTGQLSAGVAYNYLQEPPQSAELLSGPYLIRNRYLKRHIGCYSCTQSCHRYTEIESGPYAGTATLGPEFETYSSLGAGIGLSDPETVIKANDLVGELGMDTISTGVVIQWAMENFERGIMSSHDTDGLELTFGNDAAVLQVIPMIANKEGAIGKLLALGVQKASEKIGQNSYQWALCNSKGLEQSRVETRVVKSYALAFAVNPRGPDHLHTECMAAGGATGEMRDLLERITGKHWPESATYYPEIVKWHEDIYAVAEALGFCAFTCTSAMAILEDEMAEILQLATGRQIAAPELMQIGERIVTLEKCYNAREGADRTLDDLPWRIMNEPLPSGMVTSKQWLNEMLNRYYCLHGWSPITSWPTTETLQKLDLTECIPAVSGALPSP